MIRSYGRLKTKTSSTPDRVETCPQSEEHLLSNGVIDLYFGGGPITTHHRTSSIVSTTRSKAMPSAANMCIHSTKSLDYSGSVSTPSRIDWPDHGVYYTYYDGHRESVTGHALADAAARAAFGVNLGTAVLGASGQAFINDAATRLRPDLTTVSVPNFLADIGDITSLVELWRKNLSLAKNLAGAHLNYKFGWKPTIGDLQQMVEGVTNLQAKLAAFEKSCGTIQSGRTTCLKENFSKSGEITFATTKKCRWSATLSKVVTGYVVWRPQPLAVLSNFDRTLRGLLDTLGFQLNPRIVWDAVPFTFVIDWFFGVGAWLQTFSVDALELPIKYVDSYLQYKESIHIESYTYYSPTSIPGNTQTGGYTSGGWVTDETLFQRMPLFPDYATLAGLGWRMPTFGQTTLLVSLATVLKK